MLRFPIHYLLKMCYDWDSKISKSSSKFELTDNWIIQCDYLEIQDKLCRLDFIEICRLALSKEVLVFGTISLVKNAKTVSTVEFSKCMEKGASCAKIYLGYSEKVPNEPETPFNGCRNGFGYSLIGVIYITSCDENCKCDFDDGECKVSAQPNSLMHLSYDLEKLFRSDAYCYEDVNLNCGGCSIPAHKVLLSARSPVFAAMFKNPMKENQKNQVDITDMDATTLRAMLTYMYTGKTSSLTVSLASDLLFAADKYLLDHLTEKCCVFLKENISLENVLRLLVLRDLCNPVLKYFAVNFISNNCAQFSEFQQREEWISLKRKNPLLALDVLSSLVISKEQKLNG